MWRWLQPLFAKIRRLFAKQRNTVAPVKVPVVRGDEEYFFLLGELLDRLVGERSYATLMAWSIQRGVKERDLAVWLRGVELDEVWRGRLGVLVGLGKRELTGVVAEILGQDEVVVARGSEVNSDDAEAWFDQGNSLFRESRYEEAIASHDRAISFKYDYHEAWYKRGNSLLKLGHYEEAIAAYDRAIFFKHDYHEAWSNRGVSLGHLGHYEEAIESYDRAISFKHDFHEACSNRGLSLGHLGHYEEAIESCDRAISFKHDFHEAWLNQGIAIYQTRGYETEIKNYETGLSHLSPLTHPQGWADLHQATGCAHYRKGQTDSDKFRLSPQVYYNKALVAFQTAEKFITNFPEAHLELIQDFMKVHSALKDPETANSYCQQGRELLKQILNNKSPHQRRKLLAKFNSFRQLEVDILLQQQQPILALEAAELCKNLCLESLHNALQETIVSPNYHQIKTLLQPASAIIYWHLSPSTLSTFILQPGTETPITLCNHNLSPLQNWIEQWDKTNSIAPAPTNSPKKDQTPLDPEFAKLDWSQLQQILEIDQIQQHLAPNITSLILIPHKDLHRLPLHQFFNHPVTYLPSLQIALNLQQNPPTQAPPIIDIIQPPEGSNLSSAEVEIATIRALFSQGRTLLNKTTTKPEFLKFIGEASKDPQISPQPQRILHFTGHSQHFARRPQESCLYLNNNETITCPDLATSNLQPYHLIVLAACQTSIVNHQTLNDEYIGLVSACLSGGASYTISSLWSVKDIASSPFFIYFYQQLAHNIPVSQALYRTSQWLRHITNQELSEFYQTLLQKHSLTTDIQEEIQDMINRHSALAHTRPFQDPYYWAAYTASGTAPELK